MTSPGAAPREPARTLPELREAQQALVHAHAEGLPALKDPAVVKRMQDLGAEIVPASKQTPEGLKTWPRRSATRR